MCHLKIDLLQLVKTQKSFATEALIDLHVPFGFGYEILKKLYCCWKGSFYQSEAMVLITQIPYLNCMHGHVYVLVGVVKTLYDSYELS